MEAVAVAGDECFGNIPGALTEYAQWVAFRFGARKANGKLDKIPVNPRTGDAAAVNAPVTWGTFTAAVAAARRGECAGIGFVFTERDPFIGIDLDQCRDPRTGVLEPWAAAIVARLDSYTEVSPSGTGVHILAAGELPAGGRKRGAIEVYGAARFFTITGSHLAGTPATIEERTEELAALHAEVFGGQEEEGGDSGGAGRGAPSEEHTPPVPDEEVLRLATGAKNGAKFSALWAGDWGGYASRSEADLALCSLLAFYCGRDPGRIDRLFRRSGLYRGKWDELHFSSGRAYGVVTVAKALAGAREFYSGGEQGAGRGAPPAEREQAWPVLATAALHGLAGDIVRALDPYTEADRAAVLLNVLAAFGNCINATAHASVQHDAHPARLFVVQVGDTSKGRKGTGWSTPRHLFSRCDPGWSKGRVKSGLSSGEGLIYNVRDAVWKKEPVKERGRVIDYQDVKVDPGEEDKRLLVIEPEFASVLTVADREGNTLSAILRQAWDDGSLSPLTKNDPLKATNAHISIVGHITRQELLARLDDTSKANGFANRFLWCLVRRSKELPEGGAVPEETVQELAEQLTGVITFARTVAEVKRDEEAKKLWAEVYHDLSEGKPGLLGAVLSRAEAQVLRLSVIYALLDTSDVVRVKHLSAALAVWEYCEQSAVLIFGQRLGDPTADRILAAIRNAGPAGMSDNDIYELFGKHKSANDRARAINFLIELGLMRAEKEETGGRPRTVYRMA